MFDQKILDIQQGVESLYILTSEKKIFFIGEISYGEGKIAMRTNEPIELTTNKNLKSEDIR